MPSGKTQTIKGPYSGPVADLAKGQKPNDGVIAWIKNLVQTGGVEREDAGRDAQHARRPSRRASFSWTAVPVTVDSTFCVEKGAKLQLLRAPSPRVGAHHRGRQGDRGARRDVELAAGSETASWPAERRAATRCRPMSCWPRTIVRGGR